VLEKQFSSHCCCNFADLQWGGTDRWTRKKGR